MWSSVHISVRVAVSESLEYRTGEYWLHEYLVHLVDTDDMSLWAGDNGVSGFNIRMGVGGKNGGNGDNGGIDGYMKSRRPMMDDNDCHESIGV